MATAYNLRAASQGKMLLGNVIAPVVTYPEAASESFKAGEFVYSASGYITVCSADPSPVLGMALNDGHNTAVGVDSTQVLLATALTAFEICIDGATDELEAADRLKLYGLTVASNIWSVDKDDTVATRCRIIDFKHAVGDEHARVYIIILAAYREVDV